MILQAWLAKYLSCIIGITGSMAVVDTAFASASSPNAPVITDFIQSLEHELKPKVFLENLQFTEQDASGANLAKAKISGSQWERMYLNDVSFVGADLHSTLFRDSQMSRASFEKARLFNTKFISVDLTGARFSGASGNPVFVGPKLKLSSADLSGVTFELESSSGVDFVGANLADASLFYGSLKGVNLSGANLAGIKFYNVDWAGAICPNGKVNQSSDPCPGAPPRAQIGAVKQPGLSPTSVSSSSTPAVPKSTPPKVVVSTVEPPASTVVSLPKAAALSTPTSSARPSTGVSKAGKSCIWYTIGKGSKRHRHLTRLRFGDGSTTLCVDGRWTGNQKSKYQNEIADRLGVGKGSTQGTDKSQTRVRPPGSCVVWVYGSASSYFKNGSISIVDGRRQRCLNGTWRALDDSRSSANSGVLVSEECQLSESGLTSSFYGQGYRWTIWAIYSDGRRKIVRTGSGYSDQIPGQCW